jgi:hypothetical protein
MLLVYKAEGCPPVRFRTDYRGHQLSQPINATAPPYIEVRDYHPQHSLRMPRDPLIQARAQGDCNPNRVPLANADSSNNWNTGTLPNGPTDLSKWIL